MKVLVQIKLVYGCALAVIRGGGGSEGGIAPPDTRVLLRV